MKLVNLTPHAIVLQFPCQDCDGSGVLCVCVFGTDSQTGYSHPCGGCGGSGHGRKTIPPSGTVARVSSTPGQPEKVDGVPVSVYSASEFRPLTGMPNVELATLYIVSIMVLQAQARMGESHDQFVAPGTGPNDGVIRNAAGQIEAVTRLVRG